MPDFSLHIFDILGILLPIALTVLAFTRGLLTEIILLIAWSVSIALAKVLFPYTQPMVADAISNAMVTDIVAIAVVVLPVVLFVRYGLEGILPDVVQSRLGHLNRGLGAALGLIRGIMLAWLLVGLMSWAFLRTASVAIHTQQAVSAKTLAANLPIRAILCDKAQAKDWSLINQLDQRRASLSVLANEIVLFNKSPQDFPVMTFSRTFSAQLCGEAKRAF